jgi:hypothetical protein
LQFLSHHNFLNICYVAPTFAYWMLPSFLIFEATKTFVSIKLTLIKWSPFYDIDFYLLLLIIFIHLWSPYDRPLIFAI